MAEESNRNFQLQNLFNVNQKVALVTGGGSGIGLMATQALAVNGAKVYITGRTEESLRESQSCITKVFLAKLSPYRQISLIKPQLTSLSRKSAQANHISIF